MEEMVEKLATVLAKAGQAVEDAEVAEEFRPHAFERVVDALLAHSGLGAPSNARLPTAPEGRTGPRTEATPHHVDSPITRIGEEAHLTEQQVKEVYRLDGGEELSIVVASNKIDGNKATGSREISLLVAGGRQAAGFEEWTKLKRARETCEHYNRLDSSNYAATVKGMSDVFNFHGQRSNREVRLTMPGWEAWGELVRRLANGE